MKTTELKPTENVTLAPVGSGDLFGSVVWDFNVSNAIKADAEWWEYRNGCLRMWGDLCEANEAAYRRIFKITGRRMKAWVSILPIPQDQPCALATLACDGLVSLFLFMKYHAPTNQFTLSADDLRRASQAMRWAIKHIRQGYGIDLKGEERPGPMQHPDFAEAGILNAAQALGIDLGSDLPGKIDVSDAG